MGRRKSRGEVDDSGSNVRSTSCNMWRLDFIELHRCFEGEPF